MPTPRTVVHEIKLSLTVKLLLAGVVAGLLLNALVPLLHTAPAVAQGGDNMKMNCSGQAAGILPALSINMDCTGRVR